MFCSYVMQKRYFIGSLESALVNVLFVRNANKKGKFILSGGCFTSVISSKVELQETEQDLVEYGHVVSKFREESKDFEKKRF